MNPDQPSREQIEARLTALLLGELPAEEAELLRWTISQDPELQKLHDHLKGTIGFVREAMKNPTGAPMETGTPLKLPQDRRQTLLAHFKTARPQPPQIQELSWLKRIKVSPLIPALVVIAIIALLAAVLLPVLSTSKMRSLNEVSYLGKSESTAGIHNPYQNRGTYGVSGPQVTTLPAAKTPPTPAPIALPNTESAQAKSGETSDVYSVQVVGYVNMQVPAANSQIITNQPIISADGGVVSADQANTASWNLQGQTKPISGADSPYVQKEFQNGVLATNYVANAMPIDQPQAFYRFPNGQGGESGDQSALAKREIQNANNGTASFGGLSTFQSGSSASPLGVSTAPIVELPRNSSVQSSPFANRLQNALTSNANGDQPFNFPQDQSFAGNVTNTAAVDEAQPRTYGNNFGVGNTLNYSLQAGESQGAKKGMDNEDRMVTVERAWSKPSKVTTNMALSPPTQQQYALNDLQPQSQLPQPAAPILAPPPQPAGQPDTARVGLSPRLQQLRNGQVGTGRDQASYSELKEQLDEPPTRHEAAVTVTKTPDDKTDIWRAPQPTAPIPQPEIRTSDNAFSTFSLNVSDVSFKLAMASLEKGQMPTPGSIRSEEFINAFDYHDPEPLQGEPLAFVAERSRDPFAQERDLLRFSIKAAAAGRQDGRQLNLVLLLDTSGSMERADRVAIIREALRVLAGQLQPHDVVSVVTFARTARLWADGVPGGEADATFDKVGSITPEGGTNLEEAMRLAYETALRHFIAGGMNRVVLLTDGAANLGDVDPQSLTRKVDSERRQGIALDCFGIGWDDYNDDLLEQLSSNGDGRYAFINSPDEVRTEFAAKLAGALQVAAEDVKVQVEFNPNRVTSWRQIGYAKHQLTKQQFRDNTVAAGAIASREAGNALYTIEPKADGEGPIATVRVRYRVPGTQEVHERSWLVEYTGAAPELTQSSPAMRLAVTAAETSEWMANSPFAQDVTPDELLNDLSGVPQMYGTDERPKQLEWMIREIDTLKR